MTTIQLKQRLINKIKNTNNDSILEEAYRLLELESDELEIYKLSNEQHDAIAEARQQIKDDEILGEDQANAEISKWLGK